MCKDVIPCNLVKHRNVNGLICPCVNNICYPSECKVTDQPVQSFDEQTHMRAGLLHIHGRRLTWRVQCLPDLVKTRGVGWTVAVRLSGDKQTQTTADTTGTTELWRSHLFHSAVPFVFSIRFSHHALAHTSLRMFDSVLFYLFYILFTVK